MSLSQEQMLDVMAFADGELSGKDAERVKALIEENQDAQELVRSFGALGDFVRSSQEEKSVDLAEAVMTRIGPNDIERARLRRSTRMRVGATLVALTALAAGVLIYERTRKDETASTPPSTALAQAGVQVEQVDSTQSISVFYVSDEDKPPTTVVWITDDQTE